MHCVFVSKDYLLAVSSTAVDRHGQPFRDSRNAISYVSSGPRPSCPPCGGVSPEHHREGGLTGQCGCQNPKSKFEIFDFKFYIFFHDFGKHEKSKNSADFCPTDYSIVDKSLKLFS